MNKFLLYAKDPGSGRNVIAPLIDPLKKKNEVKLYASGVALKTMQNAVDIKTIADVIDYKAIHQLLETESIDCIITGTSGTDGIEKLFWQASNDLQIPSYGILDSWMNYWIRFIPHMPNKIFIMDSFAEKEMIQLGFDKNKLIISGQPHFSEIIKQYNKINTKSIEDYKKKFVENSYEKLFLFASENITTTTDIVHPCGFSQFTVLRDLLVNWPTDFIQSTLIIRPHPNENHNEYEKFLQKDIAHKNLKVVIDSSKNSALSIKASDAILGMSSMVLIEAAIIGKPILSIQTGLISENLFMLSKSEQIKSIVDLKDLSSSLRYFVMNLPVLNFNIDFHLGATDRIIRKILKDLKERIK